MRRHPDTAICCQSRDFTRLAISVERAFVAGVNATLFMPPPLSFKQGVFALHTPAVAGEVAVVAQDAVARNSDR